MGKGLHFFFFFAAYPGSIVDLVLANAVGLCNWDVEVLATLKSLINTNIFNSLIFVEVCKLIIILYEVYRCIL